MSESTNGPKWAIIVDEAGKREIEFAFIQARRAITELFEVFERAEWQVINIDRPEKDLTEDEKSP